MFLVPVAIHGWGDDAEASFQYEGNLASDSPRSKYLFSCCILVLFAYVAGAAIAVWKVSASKTTHAELNTD
jgi:hypothetical protein